ncbi:MAG: hypothetical protein Q8M64_06300, partial [Methyloversatilis sp.]|nr:hypothetical protein [Methyloversatilis sp.]
RNSETGQQLFRLVFVNVHASPSVRLNSEDCLTSHHRQPTFGQRGGPERKPMDLIMDEAV